MNLLKKKNLFTFLLFLNLTLLRHPSLITAHDKNLEIFLFFSSLLLPPYPSYLQTISLISCIQPNINQSLHIKCTENMLAQRIIATHSYNAKRLLKDPSASALIFLHKETEMTLLEIQNTSYYFPLLKHPVDFCFCTS